MTKKTSDIITSADALLLQEEEILATAVASCMKAVQDKPTKANLQAMDAAKKALEDFRSRKTAAPEAQRFKNIREVHAYLLESGWKISERKAYDDKRLIKCQPDGSYLASDVDEYADRYLKKLDGSSEGENGLASEKLRKEIQILDEKQKQLSRRNEIDAGKWLPRSRVEQMLAERAAFLCSDLETFIHNFAPRMVEMVGGDPEKLPEFTAFALAEKEKWLDRYSQPIPFMSPITGDDRDDDLFDEIEV